jgi:hypothetical protein
LIVGDVVFRVGNLFWPPIVFVAGGLHMSIIKGANLIVRFLLELCALAAVVWTTFVSPGASVPCPLRLVLQVVIFGLAAAGLAATGYRTLAWAFIGPTAVINDVLAR